ncbi:MAG: aminodeoxychorismate/anthranilate synthase component II [Saccharofermentans sp.]|nr:aminodeoxychorismate/anthranilate synthase component II [Saccharofermentans sp.]
MLLIIDNYDSFSYNLYQMIGGIYPDIKVIRNDAMTVEEIEALKPEAIVISPGPGRPSDAGVCIDVIRALGPKIPMLGVCLGHQAMCEAYGATITYAKELMHGKQSIAKVDPTCKLYRDMSNKIKVARYHSLAADPETMPKCLKVTAKTDDGEIMGVKHEAYDMYGVQFHPESIMTPEGKTMLKNFIDIATKK